MITTELRQKATKGTNYLGRIGQALYKEGKTSDEILKDLENLGEVGSKVFAVIGAIRLLTGTDEMSQLKNKLDEIGRQISTGFANLNDKLDSEFANLPLKPAIASIDSAYHLFDVYSKNESDHQAVRDVKDNIDTATLMASVTTLMNAVRNDNYFHKIHKFLGNSPDKILKIGLNIVTTVCKANAAIVAHEKLNNEVINSTSSSQESKDQATIGIVNHYSAVFSDNGKSYVTYIQEALKTQINSFNEDDDVYEFFSKNFATKMNIVKNDHTGNCRKIVDFMHSNYPSRCFHAFITDYQTNMMSQNSFSFGYANMNSGIKIFNLKDKDKNLGSDLGKFYLTVVHSYNQCKDPNALSNRTYVVKALTESPSTSGVKLASERDASMRELQNAHIQPVHNDPDCNGSAVMGDIINDYTLGGAFQTNIDWPYTISHGFVFVGVSEVTLNTYFRATASAPSDGGNDPSKGAVWHSAKANNSWYTGGKNEFLFWMARTA